MLNSPSDMYVTYSFVHCTDPGTLLMRDYKKQEIRQRHTLLRHLRRNILRVIGPVHKIGYTFVEADEVPICDTYSNLKDAGVRCRPNCIVGLYRK